MKYDRRIKDSTIFMLVLLGTALTGIAAGLGGAFLMSYLLRNGFSGWGRLVGALIGIAAGYPSGVIGGQIILSRIFHCSGSLVTGVAGAVLGAVLVILLAEPLRLNINASLMFGTFSLMTSLLGTLGYLRRRADSNR